MRLVQVHFAPIICALFRCFPLFLKWVLGFGNVEVLDIVHVSKVGAFPMLSIYQRRSLSEALYCHGEGVYAVSLGSSCHFHALHHCFSFAWPWRSPLRPKELWFGESEKLPMPVTVLEEVQQDTSLQTLHVLLLEVLPKKKCPCIPQGIMVIKSSAQATTIEGQGRRTKMPLGCYLIYLSHPF